MHGQKIEGLELKDADGKKILSFNQFTTDTNLWNLLRSIPILDETHFDNLILDLAQEEQGQTNIEKALFRSLPSPTSKSNPDTIIKIPFIGNFQLKQAHIVLRPYQGEPIIISDVNALLTIPKERNSVALAVSGQSKQGTLSGNIEVDILLSGFDELGALELKTTPQGMIRTHSQGQMKVKSKITNFPVDILDQFLAISHPEYRGIFKDALGDRLNFFMDNTLSEEGLTLKSTLQAPQMEGSFVFKSTENGHLVLETPSTLSFNISPHFFEKLDLPVKVISPIQGEWIVDRFSLPLNCSDWMNNNETTFSSHLNLNKFQASVDSPSKDAFLRDLKASIGISKEKKGFFVTLKASSEHVSIPEIKFHILEKITLLEPAKIQMTFSPLDLKPFLPPEIDVDEPIAITTTLQKMSMPRPKQFRPDQVVLHAEIHVDPINVRTLESNEKIQIGDLEIQLDGNSLANAHMLVGADIRLLNKQSLPARLWGSLTQAYIESQIAVQKDGVVEWHDLSIQLKSDMASASLFAEVKNGNQFNLTKKGSISYVLTPPTLEKLGVTQLQQAASLRLTVDKLSTILDSRVLSKLDASGFLQMDNLHVSAKDEIPINASLKNLQIPWKISGEGNYAEVNLSAKTTLSQEKKEGELSGKIAVKNWHRQGALAFSRVIVDANLLLEGLPVAILEAFSGNSDLRELIGNELNVQLNANLDAYENAHNKTGGKLELKFRGNQFEGAALLKIGEKITLLDPHDPATFHWTLTPKRFTALRKLCHEAPSEHLILDDVSIIEGKLTSLGLPWIEKIEDTYSPRKGLGFHLAEIAMELNVTKLSVLNNKNHQNMYFEKLMAKASSANLSQKIDFSLYGNEKPFAENDKGNGDFSISGNTIDLFSTNGKLNTKMFSVNLNARANKLPLIMMCNVISLSPKVQEQIDALIGSTVNLQLNASLKQMNGAMNIKAEGNNGYFMFDGNINDGFLTLNKPFEANIKVTPKFSKSVLQELIPVLSTAVGSDKPVRIVIQPNGFYFPIRNVELADISMEEAMIDLGKIKFSQEGSIGQIFGLLDSTPISPHEPLTVWFTPLFLKMKSAGVKLERMDMLLANKFPMAIWGKIDFVKDKVSMKIGLSAQTLENAFSIKGLNEEYMLTLPLTGTTSGVSIDKGKAAAKISALIAQSKGGTKGLILGGVLEMIGGGLEDDKIPPTTSKLPWEDQFVKYRPQELPKEKKKEKFNPLKQLEKEASSILDLLR